MFTDEVLDCVDVQSVWRKRHRLATDTRESQTVAVRCTDSGSQTRGTTAASTQTEEEQRAEDVSHSHHQEEALSGLRDFLRGVEDMVLRALAANAKSHAFDGFHADWEEQSHMVSCVHRLHHPIAQENALHVTCVSWNSTGSVIACAYGRMDDGDWSSEKSFVCTWNLDRGGVHAERADLVIDVHSAVTALSFHPTLPSLITGGLYSGEVVVWDTSRTQDPLLAQTGMTAQSHREPVYEVAWVPCQSSRDLGVLSGSSGGRVLLWTLDSDHRRLLLSEGYALVMEQVPHSSYAHAKVHGSTAVGVTSLALSPWDSDTFLVGSESGLLLKCKFSAQRAAAVSRREQEGGEDGVGSSVTLRAPAVFSFRPRGSPVHSIHCSPFHRNLFLSAGTDGLVHVHSLLQANPLLTVRVSDSYVFQVRWSPTRPLVFATATGQGAVQVFDLARRSARPAVSIEVGGVASCLSFNHREPRLLAVGGADGYLHIWTLSAKLTQQLTNETLRLDQLAAEVAE